MEKVPHIEDLAQIGQAHPVAFTKAGAPSHWRITPEGQEAIYAAMARNAAEARDLDAQKIALRPKAD